MDDATLHELFIADKPEEKAALVAESIITTLSEEAALIARRCSILHWFDETVITALSKDLSPTASQLRNIYDQICALPFVEYVPWGLAFNSLTREGLLSRYTTIQPALLITAAQLAATALSAHQDDRKIMAEAFFCYAIADETTKALLVLDELVQQAARGGDQEFISGLLTLANEAQQFPFVPALPLSNILEAYGIELDPEAEPIIVHAQEERTPVSPGNQSFSANPTVLIVDDSLTVRKIVQMTLQRENIHVITAPDGLSALTVVADEMPSLILIDIDMPRMDGYHICQIIRKNLQFRQIPIILLSGRDGLFDKMRGRLAGATDYLTKPFGPKKLIEITKKYLTNWQDGTRKISQGEYKSQEQERG